MRLYEHRTWFENTFDTFIKRNYGSVNVNCMSVEIKNMAVLNQITSDGGKGLVL